MLDFKFSLNWQYGEKKGDFTLFHRPFIEGIKNWAPAFEIIAEDVLEPYVMRAFGSEGSSDGRHWKELAPSTLRGRPNTPILRVTGALMRSFQAGDTEHVQKITARTMTWGSKSPLALFHEFGTGGKVDFKRAGARKVMAKTEKARKQWEETQSSGGGGIPARPMLVYSKVLADEIGSKMMGRIAMVARQTGYGVTGMGQDRLGPGIDH